MFVKEVYDLVMSGKKPVVKFNNRIEECEELFDEGMKARIVDVYVDNGCAIFSCDMNEFLEYNKTFEKPNYYDREGNAALKWHETRYFPKDGIEKVYAMLDTDAPFEIESENGLFNKYLEEKSGLTYTEWLEIQVLQFRDMR